MGACLPSSSDFVSYVPTSFLLIINIINKSRWPWLRESVSV